MLMEHARNIILFLRMVRFQPEGFFFSRSRESPSAHLFRNRLAANPPNWNLAKEKN